MFVAVSAFLVGALLLSVMCPLACDDARGDLVPADDQAGNVVVLRSGAYEFVQHVHHV